MSSPDGLMPCVTFAQGREFKQGLNVWLWEIPATPGRSTKAFANCGSITEQGIACISHGTDMRSSFCWQVATRAARPRTFGRHCASRTACIPYQNFINLYLRDCVQAERKLHLKWAS